MVLRARKKLKQHLVTCSSNSLVGRQRDVIRWAWTKQDFKESLKAGQMQQYTSLNLPKWGRKNASVPTHIPLAIFWCLFLRLHGRLAKLSMQFSLSLRSLPAGWDRSILFSKPNLKTLLQLQWVACVMVKGRSKDLYDCEMFIRMIVLGGMVLNGFLNRMGGLKNS